MRKHYLLALAILAVAGCKTSGPTPSASASATPTPTPTPRPVYVQSGRMHATLTDAKGVTLAVLDADGANFDPLHPVEALTVRNADAVLYEDGKPTTRLRAETLVADRVKRLLTATGNARANSLSRKDTPTLRADRMVWNSDRKLLTGNGKVLVTAQPDFALPGSAFTADTKLSTYDVKQDERPATGSL